MGRNDKVEKLELETTEATPKEDLQAEAPKAKVKTVKIQVLRDCAKFNGEILKPGTIVNVSEEEAAMLCDTKFTGYHPFYGHMPQIGPLMESNPLERKELVRAKRVS